ncbi:hypothetical protein HPO96_17455 [Kribbella sandramycini]|uniref:Uncharacterized protein n=1 Tax=Kribbella sandramycini TaxID=60450 RepID=A0A7Y4P1C9_9ACTN|nr:hypothetical protein [Kribbella sandramycini]MBB6565773.1 hypothetical protein [Kribbella sandramycini]NOL42035.1 hypothetical protein [Kribbella sandramycini]
MSNEIEQRKNLHRALQRHTDRHVHFTAAFMASFVARVLPVEQLVELVGALDAAKPMQWTDTGSGPGVEH